MSTNIAPSSEKHIFALFSPITFSANHQVSTELCVVDEELARRVTQVLHLAPGDSIILFDGKQAAEVVLTKSKTPHKQVQGMIVALWPCRHLEPEIHLYVGLTKRDAWESIVYYAGQMGVTSLTPLQTTKVHRIWTGDKEYQRLEKIMLAGCEQAKQYAPARLEPVKSLEQALVHAPREHAFIAEPTGEFFKIVTADLATQKSIQKISLFIGPEGGFTADERAQLTAAGVRGLALTPSILRTQEAVAVMVGSFRSLLAA